MRADHYVLGVHHRAEDRMWRLANLTATQVLDHERHLASLNVRGRDIYIAPVRNAGLILIDDLPALALDRLRADWLASAVVVETSPENFQAWLRMAEGSLSRGSLPRRSRVSWLCGTAGIAAVSAQITSVARHDYLIRNRAARCPTGVTRGYGCTTRTGAWLPRRTASSRRCMRGWKPSARGRSCP
jgi:hypothetical protein